jgi:hypothetical protein
MNVTPKICTFGQLGTSPREFRSNVWLEGARHGKTSLVMPVKTKSRLEPTSNGSETSAENISAKHIQIKQLHYRILKIEVVGRTSLIIHAWSAKAIKMMLDNQTGEASAGKEPKDPLRDFKESLYYLPEEKGFGLPAPSFKAAIVNSANDVELAMTEVKRNVHVNDYLVPIIAPPLPETQFTDWDRKYPEELKWHHEHGAQMRMDMVRLANGNADIRFRGCFPTWACNLEIEFNERVVSAAQLANLVQAAGQSGVGEWRPSSPKVKSGEYGRFRLRQTI